ncbi:hypothetical protein [Thalassospira sp. MCCC 1A01428]|jgi:hypothetical protein|uniref:hypothetical protein n=1 Tax=Thalassospira sp. MCCC 1A01428 TaxID=1470575 RepID=UPI000A1DF0D7|nr:hypothetical protein [Thalassospira sp. MCCC 1A01428]
MIDVALSGIANRGLIALLGFLFIWAALRLLDRVSGFDFKKWINNDENRDQVGAYLRWRLAAFCFVFGLIVTFSA